MISRFPDISETYVSFTFALFLWTLQRRPALPKQCRDDRVFLRGSAQSDPDNRRRVARGRLRIKRNSFRRSSPRLKRRLRIGATEEPRGSIFPPRGQNLCFCTVAVRVLKSRENPSKDGAELWFKRSGAKHRPCFGFCTVKSPIVSRQRLLSVGFREDSTMTPMRE